VPRVDTTGGGRASDVHEPVFYVGSVARTVALEPPHVAGHERRREQNADDHRHDDRRRQGPAGRLVADALVA